MVTVFYEGQVLWSQIDANQHMRHSAYADLAAQARLNMLEGLGLKPSALLDRKIGPVIFREELLYLREIGIGDIIKVTCEVTKARSDASRWTIRHELYRGDGTKSAIITVDGAWIDIEKRKLTKLPEDIMRLFLTAPKSEDYIEEPAKTVKNLDNIAMELKESFEKAVAGSKALSSRPDNETLLQLYSLYKQATEGDINTDPPNMFDFVAKAKYDAWLKLKGMEADVAMRCYIGLVDQLSAKANKE